MKNLIWPSLTTRASPDTTRAAAPRVRLPPTPKPIPPPRVALPGQPGQPVTLVGGVTLNPGDSSEVNTDAFLNPTHFPLEVRELKWGLATPSAVYTGSLFSGFTVDATLRLGPVGRDAAGVDQFEALTAAPVPLTLLGRCVDPGLESVVQTQIVGAGSVVTLDEPLYIPPGQGLSARFGHRNLFAAPITATLAVSGKLVDKMPAKRAVPYWAPFLPPAYSQVGSGNTTDLVRVSTERDLANLTGGPLRVRRITGRIGVYTASALYTLLSDNGDGTFFAKLLQITSMRASNGCVIVKDAMPFGAVFPAWTLALESPFVMQPKSYINVALKLTAMAGTNVVNQIQPGMCLCGYRDFGGK